MILGSLLDYEDNNDADGNGMNLPASPKSPSVPMKYRPEQLYELFEEFNCGKLHRILPVTESSSLRPTEAKRTNTNTSHLSDRSKSNLKLRLSNAF